MNRVSHTTHAIAELQSKKIEILAGANADTDIAVTGIEVGDTIGSAIEYVGGSTYYRSYSNNRCNKCRKHPMQCIYCKQCAVSRMVQQKRSLRAQSKWRKV